MNSSLESQSPPSQTRPVVGALVVNFFSAEDSVNAITSLVSHVGNTDLRVALVDNSCDTEEWEKLERLVSESAISESSVSLVRSTVNSGYAGGNNRAFEEIDDGDLDVVMVVNPDCQMIAGRISDMASEVLTFPTAIYGAVTNHDDGTTTGFARISCLSGRSSEFDFSTHSAGRMPEIAFPGGHFLVMSAALWHRLGGLSNDYFLYSEEADAVLRLDCAHERVRCLDSVAVKHAGAGTTGPDVHGVSKSMVTLFHASRSRILLFRKHRVLWRFFPTVLAARLIWSCGLLLRAGPSASGAALRGTWSGITSRTSKDPRLSG